MSDLRQTKCNDVMIEYVDKGCTNPRIYVLPKVSGRLSPKRPRETPHLDKSRPRHWRLPICSVHVNVLHPQYLSLAIVIVIGPATYRHALVPDLLRYTTFKTISNPTLFAAILVSFRYCYLFTLVRSI